ncbi:MULTISPECIES: exodeoxyribonuclease VII large subunit [unclassified Marinitoga]|uniref:exodeoxyribonuclease VII large subunit n=1 Tax=unclassified Marinitoga TaxID=2640159 RepID=UPI000659E615|nr:exodeoxyribonuclease VII large subunit [Marinitoga sp. 1155]KLO25059.1 exodeoxyribonuclease VII [Marinitoga sp. 1155]
MKISENKKIFENLIDLFNWIQMELNETELFNSIIIFNGDISKAKTSSAGDLFIEVSQRNDKGKTFKISVFLSRYHIKTLLNSLGLKNIGELENKNWKFYGKLSFWPTSASLAIRLQSLVPIGESKLEKRKKAIINKLKINGLLRERKNKLDDLPPIRKIAIISSQTAAGYGDFIKNINKLSSPPLIHLYPSPMQGVEVPTGINKSLDLILNSKIDYDIIVIIRGGGAQSDLMYFNDYELAEKIAIVNNTIPVLTGIGHEQDITIPDYVSYINFSTPTEVARAIVNQIENFNNKINENFQKIYYMVNNIFLHAEFFSKNVLNNIDSTINHLFEKEKNKMNFYINSLTNFQNILSSFETWLYRELDFINYVSEHINNKINVLYNENIAFEKNIKKDFDLLESYNLKKINDYYVEITKNSPFSSFLSGGGVIIQKSRIISSVYDLDKNKELEIKLKDGEVKSDIKEIKYYREDLK